MLFSHYVLSLNDNCIAGYVLLRVIHRNQFKILFWKPWLIYGMDRYGFGIWLIPRTWEPPFLFSVAPPPPPGTSDRIACLPGHLGRGRSSDTQERLFLSFDSSVTVLRSNQAIGFAWIWICIWFFNKGSLLKDTELSLPSNLLISSHFWAKTFFFAELS